MSLLTAIRSQYILMIHKKGFQFAFLLVLLYTLLSYINNLLAIYSMDIVNIYSSMSLSAIMADDSLYSFANILYPFLIAFPFSFSYHIDNNLHISPYYLTRENKKNYIISKASSCFIGGFIVICIPFVINYLLCLITFPDNHNTVFENYQLSNYASNLTGSNIMIPVKVRTLPFLSLYIMSPKLYNLLYIFIYSVFTGIMSFFLFSLSTIIKKSKLIILIPSYLFFYFGRILNQLFYNHGNFYVNYNWFSYLYIYDFFGYDYKMFFYVSILLLLLSIGILSFAIKREEV